MDVMVGLEQCRVGVLRDLEEKIRAVEDRSATGGPAVVSGGDGVPALVAGTVHEWCGVADEPATSSSRRWTPPLLLLVDLARRARDSAGDRWVVWIGRRLWPYPISLIDARVGLGLLQRSLFVDPSDDAERIWAIDLAMSCPAVCAVVADGSGFRLPHTRRLQLAAERSDALIVLARPAAELRLPSCSTTRWLVTRARSPGNAPRWNVELVRCKGVQRTSAGTAASHWCLEWDRETVRLCVSTDVVDRPVASHTARKAG